MFLTARAALARRAARWSPVTRGLLWSVAAGFLFNLLNGTMRWVTLQVDPMQAQFLRYLMGLVVLLPLLAWRGLAAWKPQNVGGQFARGALHTVGLVLWFLALPHIALADTTAIGFTTPIFIMVGAWIFFREPMRWERWLATLAGFAGVLIVVGPKLSFGAGASGGTWHFVMLLSAPVFAASFLMTKALTRYEDASVILLWQSISVSVFSLPLALWVWQPLTWGQWSSFLLAGFLGSAGHYCLTRAIQAADISSTQSAKFLDLLWSALMGWILFADVPTQSTLIGGTLICAATIWVARRESAGAGSAGRK